MNNTNNTSSACCQIGNNAENGTEKKNNSKKNTSTFVIKATVMDCILTLPPHISCHVMRAAFNYKMTGEKSSFEEVENNDERKVCQAFFTAILPQIGKPKMTKVEEPENGFSNGKEEVGKMSEKMVFNEPEMSEKMTEEMVENKSEIVTVETTEKATIQKDTEEEPFGDEHDNFLHFYNKAMKDYPSLQLDYFNTQNALFRRWMREYGKKGLAKAVDYCAKHPKYQGEITSMDWMLDAKNFPRIMNDEL